MTAARASGCCTFGGDGPLVSHADGVLAVTTNDHLEVACWIFVGCGGGGGGRHG
jgi:hypothetical protein